MTIKDTLKQYQLVRAASAIRYRLLRFASEAIASALLLACAVVLVNAYLVSLSVRAPWLRRWSENAGVGRITLRRLSR
jgi:hypothetical protein